MIFFCIDFVNVKVGWMLVENNGVLLQHTWWDGCVGFCAVTA
jgi:hypothetical protein